jgi:hypothetical protein
MLVPSLWHVRASPAAAGQALAVLDAWHGRGRTGASSPTLIRAAPKSPSASRQTFSWFHRHCTPVRLSRGGRFRQCGRASAPTIPQRVQTIRGPNVGTGTSSDQSSREAASFILLSVEPRQEISKGSCSGPLGTLFGRIIAFAQSHGQWLIVATNFPAPSPRIGVRLLHHEMISGDRLHTTIVRHRARLCQAKPPAPLCVPATKNRGPSRGISAGA